MNIIHMDSHFYFKRKSKNDTEGKVFLNKSVFIKWRIDKGMLMHDIDYP